MLRAAIWEWERAATITAAGPLQNQLDERRDGTWKRHREPLDRTAAHEAAHSVIGLLYGRQVEHATIEPIGQTLGHVQFVSANPQSAEEHIAALHRRPKISERSQAIKEYVEGIREANPPKPKGCFREARRQVADFLARIEKLLIRHQSAINALAAELVHRATMTGDEVNQLVQWYLPERFGVLTSTPKSADGLVIRTHSGLQSGSPPSRTNSPASDGRRFFFVVAAPLTFSPEVS